MSRITEIPRSFDDPLDDVVAACLESPPAELEGAIRRACESHPDSAAEIRHRIERLRAVGLLHPASDIDDERFPEQLGEFRLVERLGSGGMGVVFRARQASLAREVALKLIRPEHLYFPQARARFRRETEAAARLHHPGIVPIHAVGEDQGLPFFAMELVGGATLANALRELRVELPAQLDGSDLALALQRCVPEWVKWDETTAKASFHGGYADSIVRLVVQIADALHHAHVRGVLHRDVKPSNVAITDEGRTQLFDFGLASLGGDALRLTKSRTELGSLAYMSPEQLRGSGEALDARSDVYSLGVTLYEALALQLPFAEADPLDTRRAILEGAAPPLRSRNSAVSRDLETVCAKAMEPDAARRYPDAAAFARDLRNVLERHPVEARPASAARKAARLVRRHPIATAAIVLAIALPSAYSWQKSVHARELGKALGTAQLERTTAQREARQSGQINAFLLRLFSSVDPANARGREVSARDLLDDGARRLETELADQPIVRAKLLNTIGVSYTRLGEWERAERALQHAHALSESTAGANSLPMAESLQALADFESELGRPEAREHAQRAVELYEQLEPTPTIDRVDAMVMYALTLDAEGKSHDAALIYEQALEVVDRLPEEDQDRARLSVLVNLANAKIDTGEYESVIALAREAIDLQRSIDPSPHPSISSSLNAIGLALTLLKRYDEALVVYDEAFAEERRLSGEASTRLAAFYVSQSKALLELGRVGEAIDGLERASAMLASLAPATHPFAIACNERLGATYHRAARWKDALSLFETLLPVTEEASEPGDGRVLGIEMYLAITREALGDWTGLESGLVAAIESAHRLQSENDDGVESQAHAHLARALARRGELTAAKEHIARSIALRGRADETTVGGAWSRFGAGVVAQLDGDLETARLELEPLAALETGPFYAPNVPALARAHLAAVIRTSEPERARELAERALVELQGRLGSEHPETRAAAAFVDSLR